MDSTEARFRKIESLLDQQVSNLKSGGALAGITSRDLSARNYHYKNQVLTWSWQFVRDIALSGETNRVSICLAYDEPLGRDDALTVSIRSEIFQPGQISRINRRHEYQVAIPEIEQTSLEPLLKRAFEEGTKLLPL